MAHKALIDAGFTPDFEPAAMSELSKIAHQIHTTADTRDLRHLVWSSIDNTESMDLDQIEYAEKLPDGNTRLLVGIADVDAFVPKGSALDLHAANNTTSVYTGVVTFPMFPEKLSNDISSLLPGSDKICLVVELVVNQTGTVISTDVYRALVQNYAKLAYSSIAKWFEDEHENKLPLKAPVKGLAEQLELQRQESGLFHDLRVKNGALNVETIEARPVTVNGNIVDITTTDHNEARDLIENLMVAANSAIAMLLDKKGTYSLRRIVREPKRWSRIVEIAKELGDSLPDNPDPRALSEFLSRRKKADPDHFPDLCLSVIKLLGPGEYVVVRSGQAHEGHFGLAVHDYTHSTAPNRRFPDLVTQRLLKAIIDGKDCPYSEDELTVIAQRCTDMGSAANKVERFMRKAAAAQLLSTRIGEVFKAIVTGVKEDGVYVRISKPSAEGRLIKGQEHVDIGDKIKVRLLSTNPAQGFIDFQRV